MVCNTMETASSVLLCHPKVLETEKMGKHNHMNSFDNCQIMGSKSR